MNRRAWLAGASGLIGGYCLDLLLEGETYDEVVTLVRQPLPRSHSKLRQVEVDFARLDEAPGLGTPDDVFCCLGTTLARAGSREAFCRVDHDFVVGLARCGHRLEATQFLVVSSLGANPSAGVFYNRVKGETERDLAKLELPRLQIFRPSLLLGPRREFRPAERLSAWLMRATGWLLVGPARRYRAIEAKTVARAMVRVALACPPGINVYESDGIADLGANQR